MPPPATPLDSAEPTSVPFTPQKPTDWKDIPMILSAGGIARNRVDAWFRSLDITVFRGADPVAPVAAIGTTATPNRAAEHNAPALSFTGDATILHYFAERTSNTTEFFASAELANISTSIGTGGGYVNSTLTLDPALATSASQAHTAITEHASTNAHGWSVALAKATDRTDPTGDVTTPAAGSSIPSGVTAINGIASDDISGVNRVLVQVRRVTNPREYWNGTAWVPNWSWNLATLNGDNTWTLTGVNFDQTGGYQIALNIRDNVGNVAIDTENPITNFTISTADTTPPTVALTTVTSQTPGLVDLEGEVTDDNSGVDRLRVNIRNTQTGNYWNGTAWVPNWSWNLATLNGDDTWTLPQVDLTTPGAYRTLLWAWDNQDNRANWTDNPQLTITVN